MGKRVLAILPVLAIASLAGANYAIGPAFDIFSEWAVFAYIFAVVITEAWIIGHRLNITWARSIGTSIGANFVTTVIGIVIGIPTVGMMLIGGLVDPNPFLSTVLFLTVFGLISGLFESLFWFTVRGETSKRVIFGRTMLAHFVGIPLGLLIFLIPPRPYVGLEHGSLFVKKAVVDRALQELSEELPSGTRVPSVRSARELMAYLAQHSTRYTNVEHTWVAALFLPEYGRFDVGQNRGRSMMFNEQVAGKSVNKSTRPVWILRSPPDQPYGFVYDPFKKRIVETHSRQYLGY